MMATRADVVRVARSYIDTPFHHAARAPGIGLDCGGLVICIGRELGIWPIDFDVPPYTPIPDGHSFMAMCDAHLVPVRRANMAPGDVVVVRIEVQPQHMGVVGDYRYGGFSIIHASSARRTERVIETRLMFSRRLQFVAAFAFPGLA